MKRDHHPARRAMALLLCVAQVAPLLPRTALARQVADPTAPGAQQATVLRAGNGVPVVNITTPSAAGVSRNVWRQFDVDGNGVVLNNSRGDASTQLGGWVGGNPWLAAGSARVILNEVNSTHASQLRGFVEVGGQRADVVIANPAGIVVDGGGFINASRATLTTGQPLMNGGALQGFAVQQGLVRVQGAGLDASSTEHAQILARAVEVNAGLWAQRLDMVTGANTVSADAAAITPSTPAAGDTPAFALDVSAIGGMYAGKIRLVGTEAGLGVRQTGLIDARGVLTLDVNGWLGSEGGARMFADAVAIQAEGVRNTQGAAIAARDGLTISAQEIYNTDGALLLGAGSVQLQASQRIENRSATIESLGDLDIATPRLINANDAFETELVAQPGEPYVRLRHQGVDYTRAQIGANFGRLDAYHDAPHWRVLLPSEVYPFDRFPALASDWGLSGVSPLWWGSGFTLPPTRVPSPVCDGCPDVPPVEPYGATHPAWERFGVASPGPRPHYGGTDCNDPERSCGGPEQSAFNAHQQALARYNAALDALDARIQAYNQSVNARTLRDWTVIDATQVRHEPRVLRSAPGQIAAGGNLRIAADEIVNDKSHILAGGALQVQGTSIVNTDANVTARTELSGQSVYSYYREDCSLCNDDRHYTFAPYRASTEHSVTLSVARAEPNAADAPTALIGELNNALFAPATSPTAGYLIETDPRFADQREWLSSAHLLNALSVDPASVHKRLGDGFVEQRLVREQIARLTGQRHLGDHTDDETQYLALMNAGATFARAHALQPGIALNAEQMAALTSDIVWLVAEDVTLPDGHTERVLVPGVFLAPRAGDLAPGGGLIAGREVLLQLDGGLVNGGSIAGRALVTVDAGSVEHSGRIASGGSAVMRSSDDINVQGGEVAARDALVLAAGGDIRVVSTTRSTSTKAQDSGFERTTLDRQARLHVSGEAGVLIAQAGRDLTLQAASVRNGGDGGTAIIAGRDLNLGTLTTREVDDIRWNADHHQRTERSAEHGSSMQTEGALTLQAGQHLQARAATLQAQGDLTLQSNGAIVLEAGRQTLSVDEHHRVKHRGDFASKTITEDLTLHQVGAVGSTLQGRNVVIAGGAVLTEGASIRAEQDIAVHSASVTDLRAASESRQLQRHVESRRGGVLGGESTLDVFEARGQGRATTLEAARQVTVGVAERTELQGAHITAPDIRFEHSALAPPQTAGELVLGATVERDVLSIERHSETARVWQKIVSRGHDHETLKPTELQGNVQIDPALSISAHIPAGPLREQIQALAQQPGLAHLQDLAQRTDVDWQAIELARREWDHEQQGLTGVGAAILTMVVAYFTVGMGSALAGSSTATAAGGSTTALAGTTLSTTTAAGVTTYSAAGAALNAGFTSLASSAAVSFVNNGGDLSAVLKDLGSSANVKQLLVGMAGAGLAQGLLNTLEFNGTALSEVTKAQGAGAYLGRQLIEHGARASANAALLGTPLDEALEGALVSALLSTGTAFGANAIGDLTVPDGRGGFTLNPAGQQVLHALLGCASGAVQTGSQGCAAGAAGAVLGELAAGWFNPDGSKSAAETVAFANLVAGLGGALIARNGSDAASVNIAATAGANAAEHNYLSHVEATRLASLRARQQSGQCDAACERDMAALQSLDEQRNRQLAACEGSHSAACQSARQDVRIAAAGYIRAIDSNLDLTVGREREETLALAQHSMGGVALADVAGGYIQATQEGLDALWQSAKNAVQALLGDAQAQADLREGAGQFWDTVKDPQNWPYLLGAMTPQQREELAQAYERGDAKAVGQITGAQVANLPSGGVVGSVRSTGAIGWVPASPKSGFSTNESASGLTDLTEHRSVHILNRHRAGAGLPGKTEFPARWSDKEILHYVSDVASDPMSTTGVGKWNSPYAIGTRDGVTIRVDFYPIDHPTYAGRISTAYPINSQPNQ